MNTEPDSPNAIAERWFEALDTPQKLALLSGLGMQTKAFPELGIPALRMGDGPTGVHDHKYWCTAFPAGIALAASWDTELVGEVAAAIAGEYRALGRRVVLGPTLDLQRHPAYGRGFENFGEDPFLTSRLGVAYLRSIHEQDLMAVPKHFAANNQETGKHAFDQRIDERALHEIYLPPFRAAVQEAGVGAVMGAYNQINGAFCCEHPGLLREILREQWGFEGIVISDWGGVYHGKEAFFAGCDLDMPEGREFKRARLDELVEEDPVARATLDQTVRRILRTIARWEATRPPLEVNPGALQSPEALATAHRAAHAGIILLKNEANVLPLQADQLKRLAVLGPNAARARTGGGGSSSVNPGPVESPLEALQAHAAGRFEIIHAEGAFLESDAEPIPPHLLRPSTVADGAEGLLGEYFANAALEGSPALTRLDGRIRFDWHIDGPTPEIGACYSVRWTGYFTPETSGRYEFGLIAASQMRCGARAYLDDIELFNVWETEKTRPRHSQQLALTAGKAYQLRLEFYNTLGFSRIHLTARLLPTQLLGEAVEAAKEADAAIIFAGFSSEDESEGRDRARIDLPPAQEALIRAVHAVNRRTIVVLNSGSAVLPGNWMDSIPAILTSWFPGQSGARAVTEILFGAINPSGKLPCTFPRHWEDCRALKDFPPRDPIIHYAEGLFVGYRGYDADALPVAFPFGHGLSYTTFHYDRLRLSRDDASTGATLHFRFTLKNTGTRDGAEIVQLYARARNPRHPRPPRELKGFQRVSLAAGETREIVIEMPLHHLEIYDPESQAWQFDPGSYQFEIGASSRDPRLTTEVLELP